LTENSNARIITVAGKRCRIELDGGTRTEAIARGRLFEDDRNNAVVVGDRVTVNESGGVWTVDEVLPRRNEFVRQGLRRERQVLFSNADRVLILASLAEPQTKPAAIDRFLVASLQGEIPSVLVLTKTDQDEGHEREREMRDLYAGFHLPVFPVCNFTGQGIDSLADHIREGVSAVVGNSGVGKSSLLNRLVPGLDLVVREVSAWSGKGTHTTTAALLVQSGAQAQLIDTPGMKSFVPYGITKENLAELFPDIAELAPECRFSDCRHVVEPGCAVLNAVEKERLPGSRWRSYQRMWEEIEEPY
jgi:ribosome biogenesis GTPase